MTEPLSPDQLDLLLPVLRHVAEMVQKGADLNRDDLQLLLLPSGLDEEWATGELERWVKVLVAVRGVTDPGKRELAQRALMLRGIPEAAAMLAVSIAARAEREQAAPHPRRLTATVERLDLGVLPPGQGATAEFEVQGGPGQVMVESDQVRMTPQQFGPGPTRIRVEVKPLAAGVLWTSVKLLTAGETLELPLLAQWQELAPAAESQVLESAKVEPATGQRRLPVYLLLDISASMKGAPIESVRQGLEQLQSELTDDPFTRDVVRLGVITFASKAEFVTSGLVPLPDFQFSELTPTLSIKKV